MNTHPNPDLDADTTLLREHSAVHGTPLLPRIGIVEVAVNDVEAVHAALDAAGWFPGARVEMSTNRESVAVVFVFDEYACPVEDVADSISFVTGYATTVLDVRDAPTPAEQAHRSYHVVPDARSHRVRAQCVCGWRSDWLTAAGMAGAAHDLHIAEVSK